jgi:hypothetical protein
MGPGAGAGGPLVRLSLTKGTLMLALEMLKSLEKLRPVDQPADYLCGPETFRALLVKFQFIPQTQKTFQVDAGEVHVTIHQSLLVPDDGRFYPYPVSAKATFPELPRSF